MSDLKQEILELEASNAKHTRYWLGRLCEAMAIMHRVELLNHGTQVVITANSEEDNRLLDIFQSLLNLSTRLHNHRRNCENVEIKPFWKEWKEAINE